MGRNNDLAAVVGQKTVSGGDVMKTQTRKEFCQTCLKMTLAGLGIPLLFRSAKASSGQDARPNAAQEPMIAYCGITCSECPAYIATQKNDDALRAETAKKWSELFKSNLKPEDINCDGCPSDSTRIINYCRICEIRKCARDKKVLNCAYCADYPCQKLSAFLAQAPEAKATLEKIRKDKNK
jgi:hypothetical protein